MRIEERHTYSGMIAKNYAFYTIKYTSRTYFIRSRGRSRKQFIRSIKIIDMLLAGR